MTYEAIGVRSDGSQVRMRRLTAEDQESFARNIQEAGDVITRFFRENPEVYKKIRPQLN